MKKARFSAIIATFLVVIGLTACNVSQKDTESTDPKPTQNANTDSSQTNVDVSLTKEDATSIAQEKLPTGYTATASGKVTIHEPDTNTDQDYYTFEVVDSSENVIGHIAVDENSGNCYNYEGEGTISDYSNFILYDAATDAQCDWNGTFSDSDTSLELAQEDDHSFWYTFSDGTQGVARISGNTGASNDGNLLFTWTDASTLNIADEKDTYSGSYTLHTTEN